MKEILARYKVLKKESEQLEKEFGKHVAKVKREAIQKINDAGFLCMLENEGRKWKSRYKCKDVKGLKVLECNCIQDDNVLDHISEPWSSKKPGVTFEVVESSPELLKALKKLGFYQESEKECRNRSLWNYPLF